jgi:hypothetical protein
MQPEDTVPCLQETLNLRPFVTFQNKIIFYGEELLVPCPNHKLENYSLSAVHDCLCNTLKFTNTLHICRKQL